MAKRKATPAGNKDSENKPESAPAPAGSGPTQAQPPTKKAAKPRRAKRSPKTARKPRRQTRAKASASRPARPSRAKARRRYAPAERANILATARREGLTGAQVSERFGVSSLSYYTWRKKAADPMLSGAKPEVRAFAKQMGRTVDAAVDVAEMIRREIRIQIGRLTPEIIESEIGRLVSGITGRQRRRGPGSTLVEERRVPRGEAAVVVAPGEGRFIAVGSTGVCSAQSSDHIRPLQVLRRPPRREASGSYRYLSSGANHWSYGGRALESARRVQTLRAKRPA